MPTLKLTATFIGEPTDEVPISKNKEYSIELHAHNSHTVRIFVEKSMYRIPYNSLSSFLRNWGAIKHRV